MFSCFKYCSDTIYSPKPTALHVTTYCLWKFSKSLLSVTITNLALSTNNSRRNDSTHRDTDGCIIHCSAECHPAVCRYANCLCSMLRRWLNIWFNANIKTRRFAQQLNVPWPRQRGLSFTTIPTSCKIFIDFV